MQKEIEKFIEEQHDAWRNDGKNLTSVVKDSVRFGLELALKAHEQDLTCYKIRELIDSLK